jgi:hypothetical protein
VKSSNGWALNPHDTLRVLVVFVELDYEGSNLEVPLPEASDAWKPGELPGYADTLFSPGPEFEDKGYMTRYYREMSLGNLTVYGDYLPELYTLKYADLKPQNKGGIFMALASQMEKKPIKTRNGYGHEAFDLWENSKGSGTPKERRGGEFEGIDHIMLLLRNYHKIPKGTGQASSGSFGIIAGKRTDSYSTFGGGGNFPFLIMRHELNHLFIGGNNFHAGGGNTNIFTSYHFNLQAGWSMMGAAHSSFLTCAGWDRYWLGWKNPDHTFLISARDSLGAEVNGDLSVENGAGIYILRDFITTGDVLRIRLPFIPEEEFQQWIWIENHTTQSLNGSPFDRFSYEGHDCVAGAKPGLYMTYQIDADEREGTSIYGNVYSDYLKPMPADGAYDIQWEDTAPDLGWCVNNVRYYPYMFKPEFENPLTGNHALEFGMYYDNSTVKIDRESQRELGTRKVGETYERLSHLGHPRYGFREYEKTGLGIGTNPSTASVLTNLNSKQKRSEDARNNDRIYLNGWSLEIIETFPDGSIKLQLNTKDSLMAENRRWAGPEIILNNHNPDGTDLYVEGRLLLDRGQTLTRFDEPDTLDGKVYFTDPTNLILTGGSKLLVEGELIIRKDSELHLNSGSELEVLRGGRIIIEDHGILKLEDGSRIYGRGKIRTRSNGKIVPAMRDQYDQIKTMKCGKKGIILPD